MRSPYLELVAGYFAVICIVFEILTAVIFTILRLELMFAARCYCKAQHTLTIWPKVIWEQAASPLLVADPLITAVHNRSTVFVWWPQCARSSNIRFLGPTYRPKRHIDRFSHFCTTDAAFSLYVVFCWQITSPPPKKKQIPFSRGDLDRHLRIRGSLDLAPNPPRDRDRLSHFCGIGMSATNGQSDWPTDSPGNNRSLTLYITQLPKG